MRQQKTRILLYSHDTYGLGHIRRTLAISHQIAHDLPKSRQLIVTGSAVSGAYDLPAHTEVIKLPGLSKRSSGKYKARALPLKLKKMIKWRKQMLVQVVDYFDPDIVLVDKAPAGAQQELLPALKKLQRDYPRTKLVLGMRDIEDSPERTQRQWQKDGSYDLMEAIYDMILLYGQRSFFDPVAAYQLSPTIASKLVEVGYISRPFTPAPTLEDVPLPADKPLILVTIGGGGDGYDIISDYLDMVNEWGDTPFHSLIVTGPLMAERFQDQLADTDHRDVTILPFTPHLMQYMDQAELVISMAGYNSTTELLSLGKKMILIPRNTIREEQRIRAERLAAHGMATYLPRAEMSPTRLRRAIRQQLAASAPEVDLSLDGLPRTTAALSALIDGRKPTKIRKQTASNNNGNRFAAFLPA